ncbi:MAG: hypothetical protein methR_P2719 [Methyloprofundus sp.]|nr:MAG: hypothetical protein methR_P2719 [Methyloprofundus sp.]
MQANVGGLDKKIRIAAGIIIIGTGALMQSWWGAIGIVPLATALINWCPAYLPLGISTCNTPDSE